MRTKILFAFIYLIFAGLEISAQTIISSTFTGSRTIAQITSSTNYQAQYSIEMYKVLYTTTGTDGMPDTASGLISLPVTNDEVSTIVYMHGTTSGPNVVPSNLNTDLSAIFFFSGQGYVVLAPDFLGLGNSRGFHPYCHAETQATAGMDMMLSAEAYMGNYSVNVDDRIYITGYSQGGHAAMALQQYLEVNHPGMFNIRASAPLSGPYSISGVMRDLILGNNVYYYGAYIPYVLLGYQEVYGNLYSDLESVFKPGISNSVNAFYNGDINLTTLNLQMVTFLIANVGQIVPKHIMLNEFIAALETDSMHPVNIALRDNDTYKWATQIPTRIFYCEADDQVPYQNSIVAAAYMQNAGSANVQAVSVGANLNHSGCVAPALLAAYNFFQEVEEVVETTNLSTDLNRSSVYPNPNRGLLHVILDQNQIDMSGAEISFFDLQGRLIYSAPLQPGENTIYTPERMPDGLYSYRIVSGSSFKSGNFILQRN